MGERVDGVAVVGLDEGQLVGHLFRIFTRGNGGDADGLGHVELFLVQVAEGPAEVGYAVDVAWLVHLHRHVFLFTSRKGGGKACRQQQAGEEARGPLGQFHFHYLF